MATETRLSDVVDAFQREGRYGFNRSEIERLGRASGGAIDKALGRLVRRHRIVRVRNGFYVILPVEYSATGMTPFDWFLDDLMRSLDLSYYVGLQSAAAFYGAGHQQIQSVQVVAPRQERPIRHPRLVIQFFSKKAFRTTPRRQIKGHAGMLPVSSPEATAFDLVRYSRRIGGIDAVATVLDELGEAMDPAMLADAARFETEIAQIQRLGWLLDRLGQARLADALHGSLPPTAPLARTRLDPTGSWGGHPSGNRWRVVENSQPGPDR